MSTPTQTFLTKLEADAIAANEAEGAFRKRMGEELASLERKRAFAFRRLNLMREVAKAVALAGNEDEAVARGLAAVRSELGWDSETESRAETLAHLAPAIRAAFAEAAAPGENAVLDPTEALAEFESWYEVTHGRSFWVLFDQELPDLPLVELA